MELNWLSPDWDAGLCLPKLAINDIKSRGIKALAIDVDGTILPRSEQNPHSSVLEWLNEAKNAFNIHLLSNNPSKSRIRRVAELVKVDYTYAASKPRKSSVLKVIEKFDTSQKTIAIIGDRIFTDVLVGKRLDLYTILVRPIGENGCQSKNKTFQELEQKLASIFLGLIKK